jgi:hypothetical protein
VTCTWISDSLIFPCFLDCMPPSWGTVLNHSTMHTVFCSFISTGVITWTETFFNMMPLRFSDKIVTSRIESTVNTLCVCVCVCVWEREREREILIILISCNSSWKYNFSYI